MPWKMIIAKCWGASLKDLEGLPPEQAIQSMGRGYRQLASGEPEITRTDDFDMSATFKVEKEPGIWYEVTVEIDVLWQALIRIYRDQREKQLDRMVRQVDDEIERMGMLRDVLNRILEAENAKTSQDSQ